MMAICISVITGCQNDNTSNNSGELDNGVSAIEDAMSQGNVSDLTQQAVLNTKADAQNIQVLYLWENGNVPAKTKFTKSMTGYFDNWDFRPYVTAIPVKSGVKAKGAVDVARAVRFIRKNADVYGINPDAIAVMG